MRRSRQTPLTFALDPEEGGWLDSIKQHHHENQETRARVSSLGNAVVLAASVAVMLSIDFPMVGLLLAARSASLAGIV